MPRDDLNIVIVAVEMLIVSVTFTAQPKMFSVYLYVCVSVSQGVNSLLWSQYCPLYTGQSERFNELKQWFLKSSDAQLHFNPDYTGTLIL